MPRGIRGNGQKIERNAPKECEEMEQEFERNAIAKCAEECGGNARNANGMRTKCEPNALENAGNGQTFERKTANELRHGMRGN